MKNYMKLLIKYCLLVGLLVFISCTDRSTVHDGTAFPKKIDPNFRPSKDFSNFEPKSSAYKVNRGRNMALIQSLSNASIHAVFEGDLLGNENARVVKILPNKVIMSDLGTEVTLMYNKNGISQSTGEGESE